MSSPRRMPAAVAEHLSDPVAVAREVIESTGIPDDGRVRHIRAWGTGPDRAGAEAALIPSGVARAAHNRRGYRLRRRRTT